MLRPWGEREVFVLFCWVLGNSRPQTHKAGTLALWPFPPLQKNLLILQLGAKLKGLEFRLILVGPGSITGTNSLPTTARSNPQSTGLVVVVSEHYKVLPNKRE